MPARYLGETAGSTRIVTEGGVRANGKRERAALRSQKGFLLERAVNWRRHAISAYTWMRTNKGPHRQWLHHVRRADDPYCQCGPSNVIQSGEHITFQCTMHSQARHTLLAGRQSWHELDSPRWIKTGQKDEEKEDGVELFFLYLFHQLRN